MYEKLEPPLRTQDAPLLCLNRNIYTKAENSRSYIYQPILIIFRFSL